MDATDVDCRARKGDEPPTARVVPVLLVVGEDLEGDAGLPEANEGGVRGRHDVLDHGASTVIAEPPQSRHELGRACRVGDHVTRLDGDPTALEPVQLGRPGCRSVVTGPARDAHGVRVPRTAWSVPRPPNQAAPPLSKGHRGSFLDI